MFRRAAVVVVIGLVPIAVLAACSDPPAKPAPSVTGTPNVTPGGGGGPTGAEGGVSDAGVDTGPAVCNDVVLETNIIDRIAVTADPPVATGGTVEDGLYGLTDVTAFVGAAGVGGPTGITVRATMRITQGKLDDIVELGGVGKTPSTKRSSSGYSATGATLAQTELCPQVGGGKQRQFTANPPLLILTDLVTKEAFTFTKR